MKAEPLSALIPHAVPRSCQDEEGIEFNSHGPVEHPDQLLSRQGGGEVGKSFNICKKNTRQQGGTGWGESTLIF